MTSNSDTTGSNSKGVASRSYTIPLHPGLNNRQACCSHPSSSSAQMIWVGRILFLSCLCASAVILAYFGHKVIASGEHELARQQYDAIADRALDAAQAMTFRKTRGAKSMASIISHRFPNSEAWPFVHLEGYEEISSHLIEASDGRALGFCPLVQPGEELDKFEQFAYDYFDTTFGADHTIGKASFGTGIHGQINMTSQFPDRDGRYYDHTLGTYTNASKYVYLAPMLQHDTGNSSVLMRNIRNDRDRGPTLDRMMDCFYNGLEQTTNDSTSTIPAKDCGVISSFKLNADSEPQAFIYQPIRPANSSTLTGFIVSSILWGETLENIFTDKVSGIHLIISSGNQSYVYSVHEGVISLVGEDAQEIHDCKLKRYQRNISLTESAFDDSGGFTYTLTLYPTEAMFDTYNTQNPSKAAFGVGCIVAITSFMFVIYDCVLSKTIREKGSLLDSKRKFMQYISHEVRTPLNTVVMGHQILHEDLQRLFGGMDSSTDSNVNHEKKTRPLGVLIEGDAVPSPFSSTAAFESQLKSKQESILHLSEEILTSAHSAVGVLNDFLNYDKIETRTLKLDLSVLNIWHELEESVAGFRVPAEGKRINLHLDFDDSLLSKDKLLDEEQGQEVCNSAKDLPMTILEKRVIGDTARIAQVLRNLVSNSLKFTPTGGNITVQAAWIPPVCTPGQKTGDRIETTLSDETVIEASPTGFLQVSVRDTGAGMTREQLDKVFAEGVQFNVNMLQAGQGSGLGMYIAKEIVAQHGGVLTAVSEGLGKGATFIMSLPLYDIPDDSLPDSLQKLRVRPCPDNAISEETDTPRSDDNHQTTKVFEPLHILVVDDAGSNRKLLRRMLERLGHICDEAADGSEAVKKVLGDGELEVPKPYYDTILLDYEMPVLNGPDTVKILRKEGCDSFVVGITGNILPEDISHFKSCGANEVLHKPVNLQALGALWMEYGIEGGSSPNTSPKLAP